MWRLDDFDAVLECNALNDLGQLVFSFEFSPGFGGCGDEFEDHKPGGVLRQRPLGSGRPVAHRGEHALDRIGRPQMVPMLGREIVEGQQRVAVFDQAGNRLVAFRALFLDERGNRRLCRRAIRRGPDFAQIGLDRWLQNLRHLVQHVGRFVHSAALVTRRGTDLSRAFQKPSDPSPVANCGATARPRAFRSTSSSCQLCALSRMPT